MMKGGRTMEVTVNKVSLLHKMQENREQHRTIYEEALEGYRNESIVQLNRAIDEIRDGKVVRVSVNLPMPEDHTRDYDAAIGMLEMAEEDSIPLDEEQYRQYVMDEWGWKRAWLQSSAYYSVTAANLAAQS